LSVSATCVSARRRSSYRFRPDGCEVKGTSE
jgi:hypothetical protein